MCFCMHIIGKIIINIETMGLILLVTVSILYFAYAK